MVVGLTALSWLLHIAWLGKVAFAIGLVSVLLPVAARWIEWSWLKLAMILGWINSRILLTVVYFIFLLPLAWVSRLFTKDPLRLKRSNTTSLYTVRNHQYRKEDLENIW